MICKIIPIKQSRGIRDCWEYITDENKVISIEKKDNQLHRATIDTSLLNITAEEYVMGKMEFKTVLAYMENDEKTQNTTNIKEKFISGYLCEPETAIEEFLDVKLQNLQAQNKGIEEDDGNYAYHIIQSFPENLDITDEEVHQCGRELCEKLNAYQAVICSHVHPVIDEEGEVSGRCKHNHILINSHIHPNKIDPEKPNVYKYHNCTDTYHELRKWNDEIAIHHGLPIIREPERSKKYSWFKNREENKGASWTKQVAIDIKNTMRFCRSWEEFKEQMIEQGYHIRETDKTITYYTPHHTEDHKQQIREKRVGEEYTKEALENYWNARTRAEQQIATSANKKSQVPLIQSLIEEYKDNLFAEVRCTGRTGNFYLDVQLQNPYRPLNPHTLYTYFEPERTYKLSTSDHIPLAEVTGQDLFDYYERRKKEREQNQAYEEQNPDQQKYYYDTTKRNYHTGAPYRVSRWDSSGRLRTNIELICILARVIIKKEHAPTPRTSPKDALRFERNDGQMIYAGTDWKLQNLYNTMVMAREMGLENSADVSKRLDKAGKDVATVRKRHRALTKQLNQMQTIDENIEKMLEVSEICESIYNMPDGDDKNNAIKQNEAALEQYRVAKHYLHLKNINTPAQIAEFQTRFASMTVHMQEVEDTMREVNEEYRKLKKIEYNLTMAQNNYYCYGPTHQMFTEQSKEQSDEQTNVRLE